MYDMEEYDGLVSERFTEVEYNGGIEMDEDPMDFVNVEEVIRYVETHRN